MPSVFLLRRCQPSLHKSRAALAGMPTDWRLCGSGERVREAVEPITLKRPQIVACDLRLLDGHACRLALQMREWPQRPQLLLLTPTTDDPQLFEALRAGASGYCIDSGNGQGLVTGLRQLAGGRAAMTPLIARQILDLSGLGRSALAQAQAPQAAQDLSAARGGLSRAAQHLLSLLAHGLLSQEISACWQLPLAEIERRLGQVYTRLHALPAAQAAGA